MEAERKLMQQRDEGGQGRAAAGELSGQHQLGLKGRAIQGWEVTRVSKKVAGFYA